MTMNFETLQLNIVSILGAAAAGRFRVTGYQTMTEDADESLDSSRLVSVYYNEGQFPKEKGGISGPSMHDPTYAIEFMVSKAAEGDLATIDNPASTALEIQTALANVKHAEHLADTSWNELAGIVYQILMDARNIDLGMSVGIISSRWIDNLRKDQPGQIGIARGILGGKLVVITGSMQLTCVLEEPILGDTGTAGEIYDTTIDLVDDDNERTGVIVDNTP
jgi:hypothetical protein